MSYLIIGLSGKARAGKDLLADILADKYNCHHVSLASYLKTECRRKYGLTFDQTDGIFKDQATSYKRSDGRYLTARDILIHEGRFTRQIDPDYYINHLETSFVENKMNVISDIRFPNESNWVKRNGGFLVRLERDAKLRGGDINDYSETALDNYTGFDYLLPANKNVVKEDLERVGGVVFKRSTEHFLKHAA